MKNTLSYNHIFGCIFAILSFSIYGQSAQTSKFDNSTIALAQATDKRLNNYLELKRLGYENKAIFEDLGNASFLAENYDDAIFWYKKLKEISEDGDLPKSYLKRFEYASRKTDPKSSSVVNLGHDKMVAMVKADYQIQKKKQSRFRDFEFTPSGELITDAVRPIDRGLEPLMEEIMTTENAYVAPIAVTDNGNTAYFSKAIYLKPLYGIFSKKELVHKIFRAEKVNGQWQNIKQLALCPKYASAKHPTISDDGKRLFFASNMPGTFGQYDIYVSHIGKDGSVGVAMNLGEKINTKKNDLYPNLMANNTLFFASDGHRGFGGLDVYMAQVGTKRVDWSVNLGSDINSKDDDFSIIIQKGDRMGYVMSNRGNDKNSVQHVAFYFNNENSRPVRKKEYDLFDILNNTDKIDYSTTVFENE